MLYVIALCKQTVMQWRSCKYRNKWSYGVKNLFKTITCLRYKPSVKAFSVKGASFLYHSRIKMKMAAFGFFAEILLNAISKKYSLLINFKIYIRLKMIQDEIWRPRHWVWLLNLYRFWIYNFGNFSVFSERKSFLYCRK